MPTTMLRKLQHARSQLLRLGFADRAVMICNTANATREQLRQQRVMETREVGRVEMDSRCNI